EKRISACAAAARQPQPIGESGVGYGARAGVAGGAAGELDMSELLISDDAGLRRIIMNRPDKRNALTRAMYAGMAKALREAAGRPATRAVLLTGGAQCFPAGHRKPPFCRPPGGAGASARER